MLNRESIFDIMDKLNLPIDEYWITAGAGLVIHGVKDETRDIDIGCTNELFEQLILQRHKVKISSNNSRSLKINNIIEVFENWNVDHIEYINCFPVGSLESIKKQKIELGREKDLADIKMIDNFIRGKIK
ncbi:MAG TPA: hypothetical protein VEB00_05420 [Clostridia bacterium]|nr:hypothetical protein [Clostridia bacterium]